MFRAETPAKNSVKYRFYEVRPNLNSDASNLNLVARSFYETPSVFSPRNNGFHRGASACFFRREAIVFTVANASETTFFLRKIEYIYIFNIFYPPILRRTRIFCLY